MVAAQPPLLPFGVVWPATRLGLSPGKVGDESVNLIAFCKTKSVDDPDEQAIVVFGRQAADVPSEDVTLQNGKPRESSAGLSAFAPK